MSAGEDNLLAAQLYCVQALLQECVLLQGSGPSSSCLQDTSLEDTKNPLLGSD